MTVISKDNISRALRMLQNNAEVAVEGIARRRPRISPDLRQVTFLPYNLEPSRPNLSSITLIPVVDGTPATGELGIEIVSPDRQILCQTTIPLSQVRPYEPVRFTFRHIPNSYQGTFELRVFTRNAQQSIHVLEHRFLLPLRKVRRWRPRVLCGLSFGMHDAQTGYTPQPVTHAPVVTNGIQQPLPEADVQQSPTPEMTDYEKQRAQVSEKWSTPPTVKSLWQSKIYCETTMRLLTRGTAPHFMHYVKQTYFPSQPAESVLSIGSGWGDLDRTGYEAGLFRHCLGFDLSEGAVQTARNIAARLGYPLAYEVADLNRLALQGQYGPFDLVFANASLHHIQELERLFVGIDAVLKPQGLFFFHEYVGPSRFQWRPKTVAICQRILDILPKRLRGHVEEIRRASYPQFMNGDPSEAVHSEEIVSIASMFFEPIELVDGGTTLTHPLLNDIIRYFDEDDETEAAILRLIFLLEELLIQEQALESDTKLAIFRKRMVAA